MHREIFQFLQSSCVTGKSSLSLWVSTGIDRLFLTKIRLAIHEKQRSVWDSFTGIFLFSRNAPEIPRSSPSMQLEIFQIVNGHPASITSFAPSVQDVANTHRVLILPDEIYRKRLHNALNAGIFVSQFFCPQQFQSRSGHTCRV